MTRHALVFIDREGDSSIYASAGNAGEKLALRN
jgi:hypothetical protein